LKQDNSRKDKKTNIKKRLKINGVRVGVGVRVRVEVRVEVWVEVRVGVGVGVRIRVGVRDFSFKKRIIKNYYKT
jgi:hypothetical protein